MPEKKTVKRARAAARRGKSPSTQAGEFVREEIHHLREGKHGARSARQAIAIGLSKARRAGVSLRPPRPGTTSTATRRKAQRDSERARSGAATRKPSRRRSRATLSALSREGTEAASPRALSRQGRRAAAQRSPRERSAAAKRGAKTKGPVRRKVAAKKAARTRRARAD